LFLWLIWPDPPPGRWALAFFDQVALPLESVDLTAQLEPEREGVKLSGRPVFFEDPATGWEAQGTSNAKGRATAVASFAAADGPHNLQARYPGNPRRSERGVSSPGRVFVWPSEADVLVVDADRSLTDFDESRYASTNNADIPPLAGALAALRSLRGRFRIVYWTRFAARPVANIRLRAWLESAWNPAQQFPDGPVLSAEQESADGRLGEFRQQFKGKMVGVSRDPESARSFAAAGLDAYFIGDPPPDAGKIRSVPDWPAVVRALTQ
jgi:hypothetical protein